MRSFTIRQRDPADAGATCLASVAAHYQLLLPLARIRQHIGPVADGPSLVALARAAGKLGLEAKSGASTSKSLAGMPLPAIAPVLDAPGTAPHYVVIYEVTSRRVRCFDPADGRLHRRARAEFEPRWTGELLLLRPAETFAAGDHRRSVLGRFWQLVQPHRSIVAQALFGSVLYTVLGLAMSIYVQKIVDHVLVDGNRNLLNLLGISMLVVLAFQIFMGTMKSLFALQTGQQMDARLTLGYYNHLLRLPQTFFDTMRVGEIISRLDSGIKIRAFVNETALNLLVNGLILVFSFGLMFSYYWKLAALMAGILPLYAGIYWLQNRLNRRSQRRLMEQTAELDAQLVESVTAMGTVKRLGLESFAGARTEDRFMGLMAAVLKSGRQGIFSASATELVTQVFRVGLLWVGSYFVLDHELTPGELLSFYAIVGYFTPPAIALMGANKAVQDALIAADRLFEIIDLAGEEPAHARTELTPALVGDVRLHHVDFAYPGRAPVFENLSLHLRQGSITGIVGESGAGKTTLLSLLQGLYPLQGGQLTIGGLDVRHLNLPSLRRVVGIVPQQIELFSGTILDNLIAGHPLALPRVIGICRQLGVLTFIEQLPQGFATVLGERGAGLSNGQKQRLALVRALYPDPEILLLDEATAALDAAAEHYVQHTLRQLRAAGKTVVVVAHRLSSVVEADTIVVLAAGQVVETGPHEELLQAGGPYYQLWQQLLPPTASSESASSLALAGRAQVTSA